jgi:hypothetical protein
MQQTTDQILMIRPVNFSFNEETAVNNAFQVASNDTQAQQKAAAEFNNFVTLLTTNSLSVTVIEDTPLPYTPDSIFPNNWISFHHTGTIVLYPMFAPNRRLERKPSVIEQLQQKFIINEQLDFTSFENNHQFLEGTGSMVLDRENQIAYACLSPRTNKNVLQKVCDTLRYTPIVFDAIDMRQTPIYHTNVMMCVADKYVVLCEQAMVNPTEKEAVLSTIRNSGKEIVPITPDQMNHFAGNMLQVHNNKKEKLLVMSSQAFDALSVDQIKQLSTYNKIIHTPLTTIETNGGGSARCMMAEIHLPLK